MTSIDKKLRINNLIDVYGNMLTQKQLSIMKNYYEDDLSLAGISSKELISRQAVRDSLLKSVDSLEEMETKLGFLQKNNLIKSKLTKLQEKDCVNKEDISKIIRLI